VFIIISRDSPDPMYKQVVDQIKDAVGTGELNTDEHLPSIREMAVALEISDITIRRAYSELESEGFIYARPGIGFFIADVSPKKLREQKLREIRNDIERLIKRAAKYGISSDELIQLITVLKEHQNVGRSQSSGSQKVLSRVHLK
jgi:GntR family transcriptional regulator